MTTHTLYWVVSPHPDRHLALVLRVEDGPPAWDRMTDFEIGIDHHWADGAQTEFVVRGMNEERGRFPSMEEAQRFAEATYELETP